MQENHKKSKKDNFEDPLTISSLDEVDETKPKKRVSKKPKIPSPPTLERQTACSEDVDLVFREVDSVPKEDESNKKVKKQPKAKAAPKPKAEPKAKTEKKSATKPEPKKKIKKDKIDD